jgi:hypothetical protein
VDLINTTKPIVGFIDNNVFCSRVIWSETYNINQQDDPNMKTFYYTSIKDISDRQGGINYAYDDESGKGDNLFAITEKGICLLLTNKRLVTDAVGNSLVYLDSGKEGDPTFDTNFLVDEYWVRKDVGCPDEFWRGIAENQNSIFIPNRESVWKMEGLDVEDIGRLQRQMTQKSMYKAEPERGSYYQKLYPVLSSVLTGFTTPMTGIYDRQHNEYWLSIGVNEQIISLPDSIYENTKVIVLNTPPGGGGTIQIYPDTILRLVDYNINDTTEYIVVLPMALEDGDYLNIINDTLNTVLLQNNDLSTTPLLAGVAVTATKISTAQGFKVVAWIPYLGATLVYSDNVKIRNWTGYFDYMFDKLLDVSLLTPTGSQMCVLGFRDKLTYQLNEGTQINGADIISEVLFPIAPEPTATKELIDQTINSNVAPTEADFATTLALMPECIVTNFKNYTNAFYLQVPRKIAPPNHRVQNRSFVEKVINDTDETFVITSIETNYSLLK